MKKSNIQSWNVREPMPPKLLETLHTRASIGYTLNQDVRVTCFGLSEEHKFINALSERFELRSLTFEYRPYAHVNVDKLNEILSCCKTLLLGSPKLVSLSVEMACDNHHRGNDVLQLQPFEKLPSIQNLSLTSCAFTSSWRGLHVNLDVFFLQSLSLDKCRRIDILFHELRIRNAHLKALTVRLPIWRKGASNRERQRSIFKRFLDEQQYLEVLELDSLGASSRRLLNHPSRFFSSHFGHIAVIHATSTF